jgi:flagellar hook-length control protein FliK
MSSEPKSAAVPVNQPAMKADAVTQADPALATAVPATAPIAVATPKAFTKLQGTTATSDGAATLKTAIATDDADPSGAAVPSEEPSSGIGSHIPAAGEREKPGIGVEAAKPEPAKPAPSGITELAAAPHERHASAAAQLQSGPIDPSQIANPAQQPVPSAAPSVPTPQFSVTASNTLAVPLNGLALQIAVTAQSGRSRFEITLDPAELGRIDVRIDVDRHGQISSHLTVEKPETLAMLRQDAPQLQRALDNAGFKTGDNGLQFSLRDQSSSGHSRGDETAPNAQRLVIGEDEGVAAALAGRSYGRATGSGGGIDIRV